MRLSKVLFCLILLFPGLALADADYYKVVTVVTTTSTTTTTTTSTTTTTLAGDACGTDNLVFSSHFEGPGEVGTNFDVTTGTPAGCNSDATKTITYASGAVNSTDQFVDGAYSFFRAGANDVGSFTLDDIAVDSAISVEFDLYITTHTAGTMVLNFGDGLSDSRWQIKLYGSDELQILGFINDTDANGLLNTEGLNVGLNTWYKIRIRTRIGSTDPWVEVTKNGAGDITDTDDTINRNNVLNVGYIGTSLATAGVFHVDGLKIYNTWKTGDEWGD